MYLFRQHTSSITAKMPATLVFIFVLFSTSYISSFVFFFFSLQQLVMEEFRPSFGSGERGLEIVSGRGGGGGEYGQVYAMSSSGPRMAGVGAVAAKPWGGFTDPEMKRRKRVAKYKVYSIEGRVKASIKRGIRWIKAKCSEMVHGY